MRKAASKPNVSPELLRQLRAAAALPDGQIDTSDPDAPEVRDWSTAVRGRFWRPVKRQKTLRIDADVLAWYEAQGPGYQTRINRTLRASMLHALRRQKKAGKASS